jgi:hypothetical protein
VLSDRAAVERQLDHMAKLMRGGDVSLEKEMRKGLVLILVVACAEGQVRALVNFVSTVRPPIDPRNWKL